METPEFFQTSPHYNAQFSSTAKNIDHFIIDDLLDFPSDEAAAMEDAAQFPAAAAAAITSTDSSLLDNSSFSDLQPAAHFASELCVPYDDMAEELEWLSNIVDESFCSEDLQKLHLIQPPPPAVNEPVRALPSVPAKARSKRSRAAPGNWASRLLAVSGPTSPAQSTSSLSSEPKKKEVGPAESEGRRCLHCATDKTPQWRTGPMGPKTLCNACGVRYKSGRLVPEYRPAASPTFVLTKHSNSHRKVMELRRQKEAQQQFLHHHHQSVMFDVSSSSSNRGDDYLIHQHIGPDYRQLI